MKLLKKIIKNKIFFVFAILACFFFPSSIYRRGEGESVAVVTCLAIDKKEDKIEVSAIVIVPSTGKNLERKVEFTSAVGTSVNTCVTQIGVNLGKKVGVAHIESILISDEILEEDLMKQIFYFLNASNLVTNSILVNTKNGKEVLQLLQKEKLISNLGVKEMIDYGSKNIYNCDSNIDSFFTSYFSVNPIYMLPVIEVEELENDSQATEEGGDSGNPLGQNTESSSDGSDKKKIIKNSGKIAILKHGKKVGELKDRQREIFKLLCKNTVDGTFTIDGVTDDYVSNAEVDFEIIQTNVINTVSFIEKNPYFHVGLNMIIKVDEYVAEYYDYQTMDSLESKVTEEIKIKIEKVFKDSLGELITFMKENDLDLFNLRKKFTAYKYKKWIEYQSAHNPDNILDDILFGMTISIKGKI